MAALFAYESQYGEAPEAAHLFPQQQEIRERLAALARFYGNLIGVKYGEPFVLEMSGHPFNGNLPIGLRLKECADLVGHLHQPVNIHSGSLDRPLALLSRHRDILLGLVAG